MRRSNLSSNATRWILALALGSTVGCADSPTWECGEDGVESADWLDDPADLERFRGVRRICGDLQVSGDIASLEALAALEIVEGSLLIDRSQIISLEPLANLREVKGHLGFTDNPDLQEINLPSLELVGGELGIAGNPELRSIDVSDVTSVGGALFIATNSQLEDIFPMSSLSTVLSIYLTQNLLLTEYRIPAALLSVEEILIAENSNLIVVEGGESLVRAEMITIVANEWLERWEFHGSGEVSTLSISSNPSLVTVSGLEQLNTVDSFILEDNDSLSVGPGLGATAEMVIVYIAHNDSLVDIERYANLETLGRLTVIHNPALPSNRVTASFEDVEIEYRKVDGNEGEPVPHVADCPWVGDGECDEAQTAGGLMGTGLCETDSVDCGV